MAQILVFGESGADGDPVAITAELLGAATRLNEAIGGDGVACALIGAELEMAAQAAIAAGASTVYRAQHDALAQYQTDSYLPVAAAIVEQVAPAIVLFGQTSLGRDLAPRLATRLGSAVAMDALALAAAGDRVQVTRSCYGGNARQVVTVESDPQVVTVRAKSQDPLPEDTSRTGDIVAVDAAPGAARARVVGKETADTSGVRLEDATIVVSGGRGLGAPEAFADLERIAADLGAAVGASRAACDLGWYPPSQQVGLTGTIVSPELYVAIAISGASQHMAGCGGSKNIIAINKDPDANIFRYCRFGIVDDYKKVLPQLELELKQLVADR
ncbi:MAG: electron transfer flavoprotein alpha subunit [Chloroflexi bacterium]|nr:MAG: electron transfer flavoprotein alpha subunit [Chloroflexota bacterium]